MPFSSLFIILVMAGIIPIGVASLFGLELHAFLLYNLFLFGAWVVDLFITPGKSSFEAVRVCEEKLSLGTENTLTIRIRNKSSKTLKCKVKDEIPPHFNVVTGEATFTLYPHQDNEGNLVVIPQKRGEFSFGSIFARYGGVLGLCRKTLEFDSKAMLKVYPNLKDLRRFSLALIEKTRLMSGTKKSRAYGMGTEFESIKEYTEGSDYRKINWMATARAGKLMINNYQPERNQQIFIMMDCSRVMNSEINGIKKLDYSVNAAFLLADVATRKGDNTGLLAFDSEVRRFVMPGKGSGQFNLIASSLYNVEEKLVTADYRNALLYLNDRQKRRSLLCIFTELFSSEEALELVKTLKSTAIRHVPLIVTIKDERIEKAAAGHVTEMDEAYARIAAVKLLKEREKIKRIFNDSGIATIDAAPDRLSIEVVNRYLKMKALQQI